MTLSTRFTVGLRCPAATCVCMALALGATPAAAQRVQFPTPTEPIQPRSPYTVPSTAPSTPPPSLSSPYSVPSTTPAPTYTPPPTATPAAPAYPTTPFAPSPYAMPSTAAPVYNPQAVGPPPPFDPYASGSTVGPPPPALPYNFTPPPPASAYPTQPGPLFPEGAPFQWQPGTTDFLSSAEDYWTKTQRFLQELSGEYTYLYGDHEDPEDLEINRAEVSSTFAIPMFYNIDTPLLVTPGFAFNWLEGPLTDPADMLDPDLPSQLYDAYLDFAWYPRVNEWFGGELGVRTGVWSDFEYWDTDSIRLLGRGLASVAITPQLDILFGAVYLDRLEVKLLPAGGFYYRPTPEWDMYVVFPNPKIRKFMLSIGNTKWYWYGAGEYGGGSWTVQRLHVEEDRIDINDIRVIGGLEWETQTFIRGFIEAGYVWDREVIFESGAPPEFKPDDTVMVRGGIHF